MQTDIKSIQKAARSGAAIELKERAKEIIENSEFFRLQHDGKIYWKENQIGKISPGKNYLSPEVKVYSDESLELQDQQQVANTMQHWIDMQTKTLLKDLVEIQNPKTENKIIKGLCYQLFENNGVLKRDSINDLIKQINKEDRYILRKLGVKIGRYHVYQPRMVKPHAVTYKTILWNCFENIKENIYPTFGLNFIKNFKNKNSKFLLICGFETFDQYIVRIDILERLFLKILETSKNGIFELQSDMLNLLGCSKDDFKNLMLKMNYIVKNENDKIHFQYKPKKNTIKKMKYKDTSNPFAKLKNMKIIS